MKFFNVISGLTSVKSLLKLSVFVFFTLQVSCLSAQSLLQEKFIYSTECDNCQVAFSNSRKVFIITPDSLDLLKIQYSSDSTFMPGGYAEIKLDSNEVFVGMAKDSVFTLKKFRFSSLVTVNGFGLKSLMGGQSREWQSNSNSSEIWSFGRSYFVKSSSNNGMIEERDLMNDRVVNTVNYLGSDSLVKVEKFNEVIFGLFHNESRGTIAKYLDQNHGWIEFPYPVNDTSRILRNFVLLDEFTIILATGADVLTITELKIREKMDLDTASFADTIRVGDYSFFHEIKEGFSLPAKVDSLKLNSNEDILPKAGTLSEVESEGKFSVILQKFKNSKDAFEFLNAVIDVLPGSRVMSKGGEMNVVGPARVSLNSVKADSAMLFKSNINSGISEISTDFEIIPSMYVTLYLKDFKSKNTLASKVSFFDRNADSILYEDFIETGIFHFVFPKSRSDIGLTVSAQDFVPKSLRIRVDDFKMSQRFSQIVYLNPIEVEKPFSLNLNNILFDFDSHSLTEVAKSELRTLIGSLGGLKIDSVSITGHCDSIGTNKYNYSLGLRRARSVKSFLLKDLGDQISLYTETRGEDVPLESNDTEFGRQLNRRVEFYLKLRKEDKVMEFESEVGGPQQPLMPEMSSAI